MFLTNFKSSLDVNNIRKGRAKAIALCNHPPKLSITESLIFIYIRNRISLSHILLRPLLK